MDEQTPTEQPAAEPAPAEGSVLDKILGQSPQPAEATPAVPADDECPHGHGKLKDEVCATCGYRLSRSY